MSLGKQIKKARKAAGLTQRQLAERINKGFSSVQKYEMDIITPPIDVITNISKVLDIEINTLLDIKPLPEQTVPLSCDNNKTVTLYNDGLELDAFDNYLLELGYRTFVDIKRFENPKGKNGDVWIIYDRRENRFYTTNTEELNKLLVNINSYAKYQIHQLLSNLNELDSDKAYDDYKEFLHLDKKE